MIEKSKKDMEKIEQLGLQLLSSISANSTQIQNRVRREEEIRKLFEEDEDLVKESRRKIEEARANVDNARREIRKAEEDFKFASSELERIRKLYSEMTSTYDFLSDLDEIDRMSLDQVAVESSSILDITIQNVSLEIEPRGSTNRKSNRAA